MTIPLAIRTEHLSKTLGPDLTFSIMMLVLWAVGLAGLVLALFERQDITS